jgi:hypothetical protein
LSRSALFDQDITPHTTAAAAKIAPKIVQNSFMPNRYHILLVVASLAGRARLC